MKKVLPAFSAILFCLIVFFNITAANEANSNSERYFYEGVHYIASYRDCDNVNLCDLQKLTQTLLAAAEASGATVLGHLSHIFPPCGFTMAVLLSESHATIHTYPEWGACFVDLFTCGTNCSHEAFEKVLKDYLQPKNFETHVLNRD